jgi:hypothetical protein
MSTKYPGGLISKTAPTPSGPYADSSAPGVWTLEQQAYWVEQGNWPTQGNVNPDAFIENLFQTWLYTGTGASLPIVNGINLAGEGGLVWTKARNSTAYHKWYDSARGIQYAIESNTTDANQTEVTGITSFNSDGYTYGTDGNTNNPGTTYASWTFRKQPKFFDVVTYTGTGSNTTIPHNLGSAPGCMIVKCTSNAVGWNVYHRSLTSAAYQLELNTTGAEFSDPTIWNSTAPTSTEFSVGTNLGINGSGRTYVAYLFAHNAGGFGLTGTDNVISCGSYTGTGSTEQQITLGYEPQWVMIKRTDTANSWIMVDNMRGFFRTADNALCANNANAEAATVSVSGAMQPAATGFTLFNANSAVNASGGTYIYIAIRRGPMKVPTDGTKVFSPVTYTGNSSTQTLSGFGFPPDAVLLKNRSSTASTGSYFVDKLRGGDALLNTPTTSAELVGFGTTTFNQDGISLPSLANINGSGTTYIDWAFRRAPSFFDEVCYTGTGSTTAYTHNLGVAPELMIVKSRNDVNDWAVYSSALGNTKYLFLNTTAASATTYPLWASTTPSATTFTTNGTYNFVGGNGVTYAAYLFATCAGVSKVGSYTGTGTTLQIDCGFTAGARFVLIKRTDSTGDWYVWDSARGIVSGNDPYLLLNSTAAEVTSTDYVDTYSAGFEITSTAPAAINASGGTFIFLAIA